MKEIKPGKVLEDRVTNELLVVDSVDKKGTVKIHVKNETDGSKGRDETFTYQELESALGNGLIELPE